MSTVIRATAVAALVMLLLHPGLQAVPELQAIVATLCSVAIMQCSMLIKQLTNPLADISEA